MNKKYKRIPFDIELAKKINNGEVEGRIITRDNKEVKIEHIFNDIDCRHPIIVLDNHVTTLYTRKGYILCEQCKHKKDLFLEVLDEQKFKEGDIIKCNHAGWDYIGIIKKFYRDTNCYELNTFLYVNTCCNLKLDKTIYINFIDNIRIANSEEKQLLIDALKKDGSDKAIEYLKKFFSINLFETLKEDEPVLVRDWQYCEWNYAIYI